jgi:hypothetical protein
MIVYTREFPAPESCLSFLTGRIGRLLKPWDLTKTKRKNGALPHSGFGVITVASRRPGSLELAPFPFLIPEAEFQIVRPSGAQVCILRRCLCRFGGIRAIRGD